MKILIISHEYPPVGGGGANACRALSERFASEGHFVHVVTVRYGDLPYREELVSGRLIVTRVNAKRAAPDHCSAAEMFDYLKKAHKESVSILSSDDYDICLCFFGVPGGILARSLKRKYTLPYVVRMGGGDIPGFQKRFTALYKLAGPELRRIWRDSSALVANSEGLRKMAEAFCDRYPVQVIPNGVDTDMYYPSEDKRAVSEDAGNNGTVRLLTVCRIIERKGLQDIIPCLGSIESRTGRAVQWTIAGSGPYRGELERLSAECGAADKIVFAGYKAGEELAQLYRSADIFVFPSLREGMPNAVLEAMASGLPIVMRKGCQGADELVKENGLLSDGNFADTLTEIINKCETEWISMGRISRKTVTDAYTWNHIADKYLKLFRRCLSGQHEKSI